MKPNLGDKAVDLIGSWAFISIQAATLFSYTAWNTIRGMEHFDPYPFIFMNLLLSLQAAFTAPLILMSHNRMAQRERALAQLDRDRSYRILASIERLEKVLIKEVDLAVEEIKEAVEDMNDDAEDSDVESLSK